MTAADLIDLNRYPIDDLNSDRGRHMLEGIRKDLSAGGCAVLKSFIRAERIAELVDEGDRVAGTAFRSFNRTNPYFSQDDPALPPEHPVRRFDDRSNAFVPADNFGRESPLRSIYEHPAFLPFVREALQETEDRFFRYDDPLADVIINLVEEGNGFPWHFDTNNFTVTLGIRSSEDGGAFEYVPALRTATDENYSGVQKIMDGDRRRVRTLHLEPGDLQIFKGRHALHRVTPVEGSQPRYVGIFSFVEKEGMCGSVERTRQLYGRLLPRHYEREGWRDDGLRD